MGRLGKNLMWPGFEHYYPLPSEVQRGLLRDGLVVPDTSALLHSYRLSPETADAWLELLGALGDRLWVPYQVALEYQRNRLSVVAAQTSLAHKLRRDALGAVQTLKDLVQKETPQIRRSRVVELEEWQALAEDWSKGVECLFDKTLARAVDVDDAAAARDRVHISLEQSLTGRIGSPLSEPDYNALLKEGKERFSKRIPPGFMDQKKSGDDKFGDLVFWEEVLVHAGAQQRGVVIVCEDQKEDWWIRQSGRTLGPLPALREEFQRRVQKPFWLVTVAGLMKQAGDFGLPLPGGAEVAEAERLEAELSQDQARKEREGALTGSMMDALELLMSSDEEGDGDVRQRVVEILNEGLTKALRL